MRKKGGGDFGGKDGARGKRLALTSFSVPAVPRGSSSQRVETLTRFFATTRFIAGLCIVEVTGPGGLDLGYDVHGRWPKNARGCRIATTWVRISETDLGL